MRKPCRTRLFATFVLVLLFGSVGTAGGAEPRPIPTTAIMLTQQQIAEQHLQFSFGEQPPGVCGYVPNVVPPQISGGTSVGDTVTTWPGQWNPCSPPLVAVDVYWPSDGSHGTSHVVTAGDQLAGRVCSESTVWDSAGDVGGPLTACISIPQPPPPACVINQTASPAITGVASLGATLFMNGGSWQPSCGGGLSQADIRWWPDGSHSATYVVTPSDLGTNVCATVTVWDYNGAVAHADACLYIPGAPPPPPPPPPPTGCTNDAAFVSQQAPDLMPVSWTFEATVTMRNSGTCTWTAASGYQLAAPDGAWGTTLVPVVAGESIAPGQSATFAIASAAPASAGDYGFAWRMARSGIAFGQGTTALTVSVIASVDPVASYTQGSSITTEDLGGGNRCRVASNWHESTDVYHRVISHVEQGTRWCYKSGRFACPAGQRACPFFRTLTSSDAIPWSLERWNYGSCSTNTCGDLTGKAWVGAKSATLWVEGVFKSCLFIRFLGLEFCNHNTEHVATTVRGDGSYTNW